MVSVAEDELTKDTDAAGPDLWRSGTAAQANKAGAPDRYWLGMFRQSCKRQHQPVTGWYSWRYSSSTSASTEPMGSSRRVPPLTVSAMTLRRGLTC